jgi:hypothetical protein
MWKPLLANIKKAHGYLSYGMSPNQYERLCDGAEIGKMEDAYLDELQSTYSEIVQEPAQKSQNTALHEGIAMYVASDIDDGINIMSDARHSWRKNAKFTDVAFLGDLIHMVITLETVTRTDHPSSQRHELIGDKK